MWTIGLIASVGCIVAAVVCYLLAGRYRNGKGLSLFYTLFAATFAAAVCVFVPIHIATSQMTTAGFWRVGLLSLFNAMQIFTMGTEFAVVMDSMVACPEAMSMLYQAWTAAIFVLAPVFTFGFVLSLFKNISAYLQFYAYYFRDVYVFSELSEKSLILARSLKEKNKRAGIVFTDVFEENEEQSYELSAKANLLRAICFKKDLSVIRFQKHSPKRQLWFFAIGENQTENLNQALRLIENYKSVPNINLYVFSTQLESELLFNHIDKGLIKVRRVNEVRSLVNRVLYEEGATLFADAAPAPDGSKDVAAVIVGMGQHGTEMLKALSWFGQMDGYRVELTAFDHDPMAEERFAALAPELMAPEYNGVFVPGEAQYKISVHSGVDVLTLDFANKIRALSKATYVLVSLGDDNLNIQTAVNLRMLFERSGLKPRIQAIVYNARQKKALSGIENYRGQPYHIEFIGDLESSYDESVIIDSQLEAEALARHMKWSDSEEAFWAYEYNYRSSVASAIHLKARIDLGVSGAGKPDTELTEQQRDLLEVIEHRRWNAYMRSEGYVYSGSLDSASRNDLAKMHHNLVEFDSLDEETKRKDSRVGSN